MNSYDPQNEIILSICLIGRNDDYGKDFKRRLRQSMDFLAYSAEKAGVLDKIEVVLTDWNSDIPLAQAVTFSPAAAGMIKFIEVPPAVAKKHNYGNTPFHTTKSINAGLRRASGRYVCMMPGDILISEFALERLFKLLTGKLAVSFDPAANLLGVPRKFIPHYCEEKRFFKDSADIERTLVMNDFYLSSDVFPKGLMGGYGPMIMSREIFVKAKGFDEHLGGWGGSDVEMALRLSCTNPPVNLSGLGIVCYDFEPDRKMVSEKNTRLSNWDRPVAAAVEDDWGLGNETFAITPARVGNAPVAAENNLILLDQLLDKNFRYKVLLESRKIPCGDMSFISPEAIIMANITSQIYPHKVLHIGHNDASQGVAVSLFSPLSELFFVNKAENNIFTFGRTGSALCYSMHVGNVSYFPFPTEKVTAAGFGQSDGVNIKFDLISMRISCIAGNPGQIINQLSGFASAQCVWVFNYTDTEQTQTELMDCIKKIFSGKTLIHSTGYKLIIAANFSGDAAQINEHVIAKAWQPFTGNMFSKLFCNLEFRKGKILKALPVLFRQKLLSWPRTIRMIIKDQKN